MSYLGYALEALIALVFCCWIYAQNQEREQQLYQQQMFQQQMQPPVYYPEYRTMPQVIQAQPHYRHTNY